MDVVTLRTARLVLDEVVLGDVDAIAGYCADPVFQRFMTTPWPYTREHAVGFVTDYAAGGWREDREFTWAIRRAGIAGRAPLLGVVGLRRERDGRVTLGYWLGSPHRGEGIMPEAVDAVLDWGFAPDGAGAESIRWEAVVGNAASRSVANGLGFRYDGIRPSVVGDRGALDSWHAVLRADDPRTPAAGWPA